MRTLSRLPAQSGISLRAPPRRFYDTPVLTGVLDVAVQQSPASSGTEAVAERDSWPDDPECGTMKYFGEGMAAAGEALRNGLYAMWAALLPDLGVQHDRSAFAWALSWSVTFPFGPESGPLLRRRWHCAPDSYDPRLRPNRFNIDVGFAFTEPTTYFARPGYAWAWHEQGSRLGFAAGLGSTLSWRSDAALRPSLSPELALRYGECCSPGYWILTFRYDRYFAGESRDAVLLKFGFDYW